MVIFTHHNPNQESSLFLGILSSKNSSVHHVISCLWVAVHLFPTLGFSWVAEPGASFRDVGFSRLFTVGCGTTKVGEDSEQGTTTTGTWASIRLQLIGR